MHLSVAACPRVGLGASYPDRALVSTTAPRSGLEPLSSGPSEGAASRSPTWAGHTWSAASGPSRFRSSWAPNASEPPPHGPACQDHGRRHELSRAV